MPALSVTVYVHVVPLVAFKTFVVVPLPPESVQPSPRTPKMYGLVPSAAVIVTAVPHSGLLASSVADNRAVAHAWWGIAKPRRATPTKRTFLRMANHPWFPSHSLVGVPSRVTSAHHTGIFAFSQRKLRERNLCGGGRGSFWWWMAHASPKMRTGGRAGALPPVQAFLVVPTTWRWPGCVFLPLARPPLPPAPELQQVSPPPAG